MIEKKIIKVAIWLFFLFIKTAISQPFFTVGGGTNQAIYSLLADTSQNILYAGGLFSQAGVVHSNCIAKWNNLDWDSTRNQFVNPGTSQIRGIEKLNGEIYVGGILAVFDTVGNQIGYGVAKWNSIFNAWDSCGGYSYGYVQSLYVNNNILYVCGTFDSIAGIYSSKIARYDGTTWYAFPPLDTNGGGWSILSAMFYSGELYVGGNFESQVGPNMLDIAKWDGIQWLPVGNGLSGASTNARAFTIYQGKLIVGGYFNISWGDPGNNIAAWDGNSWSQLGSGTDGEIRSLVVYKGELWAGGSFSNAGGIPVSHLAKWDGTQWYSMGITLNNVVTSMVVLNNDLYIAGAFVTMNGDTVNNIIRYNDLTGFETLTLKENKIEISPNPGNGNFILTSSFHPIESIRLFDFSGRVVFLVDNILKNTYQCELNVPDGVYVAEVFVKGNVYRKKIVVVY